MIKYFKMHVLRMIYQKYRVQNSGNYYETRSECIIALHIVRIKMCCCGYIIVVNLLKLYR